MGRINEFANSSSLHENENVLFQVQLVPSYIFANVAVRYRGVSHPLADRIEHRLDLLLEFRPLQIDESAYQSDQQHREEAKHHRRSSSGGS